MTGRLRIPESATSAAIELAWIITMNTYFVRHTQNLNLHGDTIERLWNERRVAIHFPRIKGQREGTPDAESLSAGDYDLSGKKAVGALLRLAREGGYVYAEYRGQKGCLVGVVPPGSDIELVTGRRTDSDRPAVLKTLVLQKAQVVPASAQAVLTAARPRQGTISRSRRVGRQVEYIVEGIAPERALSSLSTPQQEVLCAEFLRTPQAGDEGLPRIASLMLPVGKTLRDVDVVGVSAGGRPVHAQVTYLTIGRAGGKLQRLGHYADATSDAVLFCRCDAPSQRAGVYVYPIGRAFDLFTSTEVGRVWLDIALRPLRS